MLAGLESACMSMLMGNHHFFCICMSMLAELFLQRTAKTMETSVTSINYIIYINLILVMKHNWTFEHEHRHKPTKTSI